MQETINVKNPVAEAVLQVVDIVTAPSVAFERCRVPIAWPTLTPLVLLIGTLPLYYGFNRVATAFVASHAVSSPWAMKIMWLSFWIQPVMLVAKWFLIACALLVGSQLRLLPNVTYAKLLALVVSAQVLQALHQAVQLVVANLSGASPLKPLDDVGLNLLFPPHTLVNAVGALVNPFSIWYIIVLWAGLRAISRGKPSDVTIAMVPYFVLAAGVLVGGALVKLSHGL